MSCQKVNDRIANFYSLQGENATLKQGAFALVRVLGAIGLGGLTFGITYALDAKRVVQIAAPTSVTLITLGVSEAIIGPLTTSRRRNTTPREESSGGVPQQQFQEQEAQLRRALRQVEVLTAEVEHIEAEAEEHEFRVVRAQARYRELNTDRLELIEEVDDLRAECEAKEALIEATKHENRDLEAEVERGEAYITKLEAELRKLKVEKLKLLTQLKKAKTPS